MSRYPLIPSYREILPVKSTIYLLIFCLFLTLNKLYAVSDVNVDEEK